MDINLITFIIVGFYLKCTTSQLTHIQSCLRTSSVDTECILTYVRDRVEQLATNNELQTKEQNEILLKKLISQTISTQNQLITNSTKGLATNTEINTIKDQVLGVIASNTRHLATSDQVPNRDQAIKSRVDGFETQIELMSGQMTSQNERMEEFQNDILAKVDQLLQQTATISPPPTNNPTPEACTMPAHHVINQSPPDATQPPTIASDESLPENCKDIYELGHTTSGVFTIYEPLLPSSPFRPSKTRRSIDVFCDMDTEFGGPGWLVFQRRIDASVSFNRTWNAYREGFGQLDGNLWWGNDNLALITGGAATYELRVDLEDFSNNHAYARYASFRVLDHNALFELQLGSFIDGDAGDAMFASKSAKFSTPDQDNDGTSSQHCAQTYGWSGFWFYNCAYATLNNPYNSSSSAWNKRISWYQWDNRRLKSVEMKLRPV